MFGAVVDGIVTYGPIVVTCASAAIAVLPKANDPTSVWYQVRKGLQFMAINIGNAKH